MDSQQTSSAEETAKKKHHEVPLVQLDLENVTYAPIAKSAKASGSRKKVLSNITTSIAPYKLTAWMVSQNEWSWREILNYCIIFLAHCCLIFSLFPFFLFNSFLRAPVEVGKPA